MTLPQPPRAVRMGRAQMRKIVSRSALVMAAAVGSILLVFGPAHVVVSPSMEPAIRAGDALWIRPVAEPITPGMVVTYRLDERLITHRVLSVDGETLHTKGDNNEEADPWPVPVASIVGTPVLRVPRLGYVIDFVRKPAGWGLFVVLPASLLIAEEIRKISAQVRGSRRAKAGLTPAQSARAADHAGIPEAGDGEGVHAWRAKVEELLPERGGIPRPDGRRARR